MDQREPFCQKTPRLGRIALCLRRNFGLEEPFEAMEKSLDECDLGFSWGDKEKAKKNGLLLASAADENYLIVAILVTWRIKRCNPA